MTRNVGGRGVRAVARWAAALVVCGVGLSMVGAGCGAEAPAPAGAADEQMVSRAVVHFAPDGTYTIQYSEITAAEQQEELAARARAQMAPVDGLGQAAEAITQDGSCTSSDDWFFDEPVGMTPVNEVCFTGTGTIDLSTVARGSGNWAGAIQSYLTQAYLGHVNGGGECFNFPIKTVQTNGSLGLTDLTLGSSCCSGSEQWCYCSKCPTLSHCTTTEQACFNWCVSC